MKKIRYKEAKEIAVKLFKDRYPDLEFPYSESGVHGLRKKFICSEIQFETVVLDSFDYLSKRKDYTLFWYDHGVRDPELLAEYIKGDHKICKMCSTIFRSDSSKYHAVCSDKCNTESRLSGNKRLSASKKLYNSRDPKQYAKRHNISLDEASKIVNNFNRTGSHRCIEYWLERGYSEEEARDQISLSQSKISPRCIEYWIDKGFDQESAVKEVSRVQREDAMRHVTKNAENIKNGKYSMTSQLYWTDRGLTPEEAKAKITEIQKSRSKQYFENADPLQLRQNIHMCIEYWELRYPEDFEERYSAHRNSFFGDKFTSNSSIEFFKELTSELDSDYLANNVLFGDREYCVKAPNAVYFYDFVDKKNKICIEYNGDYWHANPQIYEAEEVISYPAGRKSTAASVWEADRIKHDALRELRGYEVIVVWESDIKNNRQQIINFLRKKLGYENR